MHGKWSGLAMYAEIAGSNNVRGQSVQLRAQPRLKF
jgi:hypothetical protein